MRSSSIKSTVLALTIALTVTATAPIATARPSRVPAGTPSVAKQFEDATARATTAARRLLTRFYGFVANGLPQPPLPVDTSFTSSTTETEETLATDTTVKGRKP
jgi:hypothetical protein